jgi:hypothetical protein
MPFVPLSTDGTQRATTETLRAPRVQVALEPHEAGVTVLAIEPTGLRAIGQLDLTVADGYRRVLAPLAVDGVYGICIAESTDAGTLLCLAPAESCLPAGNWPWRPVDTVEAGTPELAAWLAAGDPPAPVGDAPGELTVALAAAGAPTRRPAHRTPAAARPAGGRRATPWVLAGVIALLMVGAITQALHGGSPSTATPLAAADASVAVPAWSPDPADTELPPVVVPSPAAAAEPVSGRAAAPRSAAPPAPAKPAPKHEEPEHQSDADAHDSDDSHESDESSKPSSSDSGSNKDSSKDDDSSSAKNKLPTFADLLKELAGQHSGSSGRSPFSLPKPGR